MSLPTSDPDHNGVNACNRGPGNQSIASGTGDQNHMTGGAMYHGSRDLNILQISATPMRPFVASGQRTNLHAEYLMGADYGGYPQRHHEQYHSPAELSCSHNNYFAAGITPGTGEWIFQEDQFKEWKNASSKTRVLWMHGNVGSGKTTILSLIIDKLTKEFEGRNDVTSLHFCFCKEEKRPLSISHFWQTLLDNLIKCRGGDESDNIHTPLKNLIARSTPRDYFQSFKKEAAKFKTIYLLIDALDNLPIVNDLNAEPLQQALNTLPRNIRILFTSRSHWKGCIINSDEQMPLSPRKEDIESYVMWRIEHNESLNTLLKDPASKEKVTKRVTDIAYRSKIFLLAALHMEDISNEVYLEGIMSKLEKLPEDANDIIDNWIGGILQQNKRAKISLARHVLTWIVYAKRNLTIEAVLDSFAIRKSGGKEYQDYRPDKSALINSCFGLVTEDEGTGTLKLVHEFVRERLKLRKPDIILDCPDVEIGQTCLQYLVARKSIHTPTAPLLSYAACYWSSHLDPDIEKLDTAGHTLVEQLFRKSENLTAAFETLTDVGDCALKNMSGLHAATYLNLKCWVDRLTGLRPYEGPGIDTQCSDGQTALHWAVSHERLSILELLMERNADANLRDKDGNTPLHKAILQHKKTAEKIVKILMRKRPSNKQARVDVPNIKNFTPLTTAIKSGPTSIASILIENLQDVNREIAKGWTCLREVICNGRDIYHLMLDGLRAKDHLDKRSMYLLKRTSEDHVLSLIDLLLWRGAELNEPTSDGWLPLTYAAEIGSLVTARRLLTRPKDPAKVDLRDPKFKRSPMGWAIMYKHLPMVQLLVEFGANLGDKNHDGHTPLIEAVFKDNAEAVWFLLKSEAQPDDKDNMGWVALLHAIERGNKDIVWMLLNAKAKVNLQATNTPSPLELALETNELSIAWLLCEHGAYINAVDNKERTLLHRFSIHGPVEVVRFLLERDADISCKDKAGRTALHYAVLERREDLVKLLAPHFSRLRIGTLNGDRDDRARPRCIDITNADGNGALSLATMMRDEKMLQILLKHKASCTVSDGKGVTALHHAARLGFNDGLRRLMDESEDIDLADHKGFTAVHHAVNSQKSDADTIRILGDQGANLEVIDKDGRTPLMLAVQLQRDVLVHRLLLSGAKIETRHARGWTAMDLAMEQKDHAIFDTLTDAMNGNMHRRVYGR